MGYNFHTEMDCPFVIRAENKVKALAALQDMDDPAKRKSWSFMSPGEMLECATLEEALECWGYAIKHAGNDIVAIEFESEKLGDDETYLWPVLAPFVEGGDIRCHGECDDTWRWVFRNGKYCKLYPEETWPDDDDGPDGGLSAEDAERMRRAARTKYGNDDIQIDDGAPLSVGDEPGCYVQACVWVTYEEAGVEHDEEE